jgi:ethanolamine utilization protein EutQ (cupin superfamily)
VTVQPVSLPPYDQTHDKPFGPARIEHRSAERGLAELGTYFMVFDSDGHSDPWTLRYEETIFVIEGQARLVAVDPDAERLIVGNPGDLIVVPKGSTVRYGAEVGTRLLLSISPVNWREVSE